MTVTRALSLPNPFAERGAKPTDFNGDYPPQAAHQNQLGGRLYNQFKVTRNRSYLQQAISAFEAAAEISLHEGRLRPYACDLSNVGFLQRESGAIEKSIATLANAIKIHRRFGHTDCLYRDITVLHAAIVDKVNLLRVKQKTHEARPYELWAARLRKEALTIAPRYNREPVNCAAHRVEQGEIGFSNQELIGTDNVNDCVCVIVRDPVSKKTGLAHFDCVVSADSLQKLFERLPCDRPLEAKIVGARFDPKDPALNVYNRHNSAQNISTVLGFLISRKVTILSASIYKVSQPTAIVVNPLTFEVIEAAPGLGDSNKLVQSAKQTLTYNGDPKPPMRISFDLTTSKERAPVLLSSNEVRRLRETIFRKGVWDICLLQARIGAIDWMKPINIEQMVALAKEYEKAYQALVNELREAIQRVRRRGGIVKEEDIQATLQVLQEHSLHVGLNSSAANQPLKKFIADSLLIRDEASYKFNIKGLRDFQFPSPETYLKSNLEK